MSIPVHRIPVVPRQRNPLYVSELFDHTLDFLAGPYPNYDVFPVAIPDHPQDALRTLAALARTCRTFSESSLNRLWYSVNMLVIRRAYCVGRNPRSKRSSLARQHIIDHYFHRIQVLFIDDSAHVAWLRRSTWEPGLLPNLRALRWWIDECIDSISMIYPFLNPNLVDLDINLADEDEGDMALFCDVCPSLCPGLKSLTLNVEESIEATAAVSRAVCNFNTLEHLDCNCPLNIIALRHLFMSPRITQLSLPSIIDTQPPSLASSDIPLSRLKELSLDCDDIGFITTLLRSQGQGELFRAKFTLQIRPTRSATHSFLSLLASQPRTSSLRWLYLTKDYVDPAFLVPADDVLHNISYDTLRPLTFFSNLRTLHIDLKSWIFLNDEQLADLAAGWPLLQFLKLDYVSVGSGPHLTFNGLLSLVVACPKLLNIQLSLDGRDIPTDNTSMNICSVPARHVSFPRSPISDPRLVGKFLSRHFPSISSSWLVRDSHDPYYDVWRQVEMYLKAQIVD